MKNQLTTVIIQDPDLFRNYLINEMKINSYCLISDDYYWEEITNQRSMNREIYVIGRNKLERKSNVLKALEFKIPIKIEKKSLYELIQIISKSIDIIATIYNPKEEKCIILFVDNKNDEFVEKQIKNFFELEVIDSGK